jgi:hypothetical protein
MARIKLQKTIVDKMGNAIIRSRQCNVSDLSYFEAEGFKKVEMNANEKAVEKSRAEAEAIEVKANKERKDLRNKIAEMKRREAGGPMGNRAKHTPSIVAAEVKK